jgi:anti-sigma factor RsiW
MNVPDEMLHPTPDRLEALAAGELDAADAAVLESHLQDCAHCRVEIEDWRTLFGALAGLPSFVPAPQFAERVMARVRVRQPVATRLARLADRTAERLLPRTPRALALLVATLSVPAAALVSLIVWIAAQPWLSIEGIAAFALQRTSALLNALPGQALVLLQRSGIGAWVGQALQGLGAGTTSIGAAVALFATLMVLSAFVVYRNVFRAPTRGSNGYASYCI